MDDNAYAASTPRGGNILFASLHELEISSILEENDTTSEIVPEASQQVEAAEAAPTRIFRCDTCTFKVTFFQRDTSVRTVINLFHKNVLCDEPP